MKMKIKGARLALCALTLTGSALLLTGCKGNPQNEAPAQEYASLTVGFSAVQTEEQYPATITGRQDVEIYPQVEGRLTQICVTEGQSVQKGQTLFVIDQVSYKAALQTAIANLNSAKAQLATAKLDYDGKIVLCQKQIISDNELQRAKNTQDAAAAAVQQMEAQVTDARNNLSYTVIKSPSNGVVGVLPYRVGTLVSASMSSPLTTVSDNHEVFVYFSLPESKVLGLIKQYGSMDKTLKEMPAVGLRLSDGTSYASQGRIESVSGVLDKQTGSASFRAVFPNPSGLLHSGGTGEIVMPSQKAKALVIPKSATFEIQDKVYAYRFINGKAVATPIRVSAINGKSYEVTDGLKQGDVILAEGVTLIKDGDEVKIKH